MQFLLCFPGIFSWKSPYVQALLGSLAGCLLVAVALALCHRRHAHLRGKLQDHAFVVNKVYHSQAGELFSNDI